MRRPLADRFWSRVQKTESCWLWTGQLRQRSDRKESNGRYGVLTLGRNAGNKGAHVVSWFLAHGEWPTLCVLHTCDTPACVNPAHLFLGTNADNVADKLAKGRQPHGDQRASKLSSENVLELFALRRAGWLGRDLALRYGINIGYVYHILSGRKWARLTAPLRLAESTTEPLRAAGAER
jgi:hypothetical protein